MDQKFGITLNAKNIFESPITFLEIGDYLFKRKGFYPGHNTKKIYEDFIIRGEN